MQNGLPNDCRALALVDACLELCGADATLDALILRLGEREDISAAKYDLEKARKADAHATDLDAAAVTD